MKKDIHLLMVHGWGFSSSFWDLIEKELSDFSIQFIDLGFINCVEKQEIKLRSIIDIGHPENIIAIGHSLGFVYLLKNFPLKFRHYIAINSFAKFAKDKTFPDGVEPRIIERMKRHLLRDGDKVLKQFYKQCGYPDYPFLSFDKVQLQKGLIWLQTDDVRLLISKIKQKLTIIASAYDPVVSSAMTKESFKNCRCHWVEDVSHLLPLTHASYCATIIKNIMGHD